MNHLKRLLPLSLVIAMLCASGAETAFAQETWADAMKAYRAYRALSKQGRYPEALPHAKRAMELARKLKGESDPHYTTGLNNLAAVYKAMGHYGRALPLYTQALQMRRKLLGDEHPKVATSLNNLAALYQAMGEYGKALPLYTQALDMRRKLMGQEHPDVAQSLNNLAALYEAMGEYGKALPLYTQALHMRRKLLRQEHPDVAASLNNLALLYWRMGDYGKALPLYTQALEIWKKAHGGEHPHVATGLNNLAALYEDMGDYGKALPLYTQALEIDKKAYGAHHPEIATDLNNLASLYEDMGDYAKALPLYTQALEIQKKVHGEEHPDVATGLNNLALLCGAMGEYGKALPLYTQALQMRKKLLGKEHPDVATGLNNLAALYGATGRERDALALMSQARKISEAHTDMVLGFTAETSKLAFLRSIEGELDLVLSLVWRHFSGDAAAAAVAGDAVLRSKGLTLDALGRQREAAALSPDPAVRQALDKLNQVRQELARATFAGPGRGGPAAYRKRLKDLEAQRDKLEAQLSRLSADFALTRRAKKADVAAVAAALPPGSVLVEFARPRIFNFKATGKERKWQPARYLAFVIRSSAGRAGRSPRPGHALEGVPTGTAARAAGATPTLVDLGDARRIDRAVNDFRASVGRTRDDMKELSPRRVEEKARQKARALYDLVIKPMQPALGDARRVLLCPEGQLSLLPFEALCDESGRYLVERYEFSYLSTGRDLIRYAGAMGDSPRRDSPPFVLVQRELDI